MLAAFGTTSCAASTPPEPGGVREFVSEVIANESNPEATDFTQFLTPRFRIAVERDRSGEDQGWLDHNPVCLCQDPEGLPITVQSISGDDSHAIVMIRAGDSAAQWQLVRFNGSWKLADIAEKPGDGDAIPSVLLALEEWAGGDEQDSPFFGCEDSDESCVLVPLGSAPDPDGKLLQLICGNDGESSSVTRYRLDGTEGIVAVSCWRDGELPQGLIWLIEFTPGDYSVWKRELADGELTWETALSAASSFDAGRAILSDDVDCKAGRTGWRGKWIWLGMRFERLKFEAVDCPA
ncbi:MAG: hypothetical protein H6918_05050 [Sphingomonadaceae bacterium]|nr:hypothetical protein [Sphingomonadaceae bacterium]